MSNLSNLEDLNENTYLTKQEILKYLNSLKILVFSFKDFIKIKLSLPFCKVKKLKQLQIKDALD